MHEHRSAEVFGEVAAERLAAHCAAEDRQTTVSYLLHLGEQAGADAAPPVGWADAHVAEVGVRGWIESQGREPDYLPLSDRHQGSSPPRTVAVRGWAWQLFRNLVAGLKRPDVSRHVSFA